MKLSGESHGKSRNGSLSDDMQKVAELFHVELQYVDGRQRVRHATPDTLLPVLQALDPSLNADSDFSKEFHRSVQAPWGELIEPVLLYFPQTRQPITFFLNLPDFDCPAESISVECCFVSEQGRARVFRQIGSSCRFGERLLIVGQSYVRMEVLLPYKPALGYYDLHIRVGLADRILSGHSLVVSAPKKCYQPTSSKKRWGVGLQLYSIRSRDNWGCGDFGDLRKIIYVAGKAWKADTIGLQPLHAATPGLASPYSPSSRLFWNPLYLDLEKIEELRVSASLLRRVRSRKFQETVKALRESSFVQYEKVWQQKLPILAAMYRSFRLNHLKPMTRRGRAFSRFVEKGGKALARFCIFQALHEYFKGTVWKKWPQAFHHPESQAVWDFHERHIVRVQFYLYVQWLCELQLKELGRTTQRSGLALGLYYDLPVGIHPDGADAWAFQDQLAQGISVGAPPDSFNLLGQSWGLLSPSPLLMRRHGYRFWRETLWHNMQHAGVLRIDHALGLFRMFWVPDGKTGQDGVYVRTYVDEILAVLALESVRNKVMVVGEDLGTVTPAIRQKLDEAGLLSYRLLFFERQEHGAFQEPSRFPSQALVAATTHDLPTLCGYWAGRDMEVKERAGLYPHHDDLQRDRMERNQDRSRLWEALMRHGLVPRSEYPDKLSLVEIQALYQYLARTPCQLLMIQLEDILAELETPNLPGAPDSAYPSWRIKLTKPLDDWLRCPDILRFAKVLRQARA
ncbi:MAG: 4-alpha-glucanotransferase [Nitrospirales bacterium]